MRVINAINVNDAWPQALSILDIEGERRSSRNGDVVVHPLPVTTVYSRPTERVLFDPVRDANPMFHLHEALWMLAGENDATWLDAFVRDFSQRYAEGDGIMHGAYGHRWRRHFALDQLDEVVRLLSADPYDRQCVIQMWDSEVDLGVPGLKDRPCNTQIYLRADRRLLDMTVTCRSNDVVYGCYGANVVHFSVLQEYLAARLGYGVGWYYQVSNNWHMYDWAQKAVNFVSAYENGRIQLKDGYPGTLPLVGDPASFDEECRRYVRDAASWIDEPDGEWENLIFPDTAWPMWMANNMRLNGNMADALHWAHSIAAPDWRKATVEWLERRIK